ncbi:MAG: hypothetical protein ACFCU5_14035 [Pleurocapsa sp.]
MTIIKTIKNLVQYITEAFVRIFTPADDQYPAIGVQPFEGTIYQPNSQTD